MRVRRPNIRLRGTRFWFRRRVPGPLTERIGRGEIARSLRTSCPREAARRARAMWLASDLVFSLVAAKKSLGREQVELILARLLTETVWGSSTVDELVEGFREGDMATFDRLFGTAGTEAVLALPANDRADVRRHLLRMLDRIETGLHAREAEAARLETRLEKLRRVTAEAAQAKKTKRALDVAMVSMAMDEPFAPWEARPAPAKVHVGLRDNPAPSSGIGQPRPGTLAAAEKQPTGPINGAAPEPGTERRSDGAPAAQMVSLPRRMAPLAAIRPTEVRVGEVLADGPASRAGLRMGDVIVRLGGRPVGSGGELVRLPGADRIGLPIALTVFRGGRLEEVGVTTAE